MPLGMVGYGKMGRRIAELSPDFQLAVGATWDRGVDLDEALPGCTPKEDWVLIEFTEPEAALENLRKLAQYGVPVVCGTTGWLAHLDEVRTAFHEHQTSLVYGPNFSVGVAIFHRIVAHAAHVMHRFEEYEAYGHELHHSQKKDAPSGTLISLVQAMRDAGYSRHVDEASTRAGFIPGTHTVGFDGPADTITMTHTARSRDGFARGALFAAQAIRRHPGVWSFTELLEREMNHV
jgi:4-hydroxy-tetrahydrodipicolinate reductase